MPVIESTGRSWKRVALGLALALSLAVPVAAMANDNADCNAIDPLLKVDSSRVVAACNRLAERGDVIGEYNLGLMYFSGQGVAQDYVRAARLFRESAEQGDAPSQYSLGLAYEDGRGVERDYVEAALWFRKAASQGYVYAQSALGFMYGIGDELPVDYVRAYLWLSLAAAAGDNDASDYREALAKNMAPEQLTEAMNLVSNWKPILPDNDQTVY